jgi:divalent metal cation (Fe/Co/Zn/Cd) transporter
MVDVLLTESAVTANPMGRAKPSATVFWLQGISVAWMLAECGLSLYAAAAAHSPAMLAFGSDSLVELLSAGVVLLQFLPRLSISERRASRVAGVLLFALALIVAITAIASFALRMHPAVTYLGLGTALAALVVMPVLATLKRREARRSGNSALAADAVQSATCAYLALIALGGVALNAALHVPWVDPLAALIAIPLLLKEGRDAWQDRACRC